MLACCTDPLTFFSHYDSRQLYQREIDDLRNREALMIAKTQAEVHSVKMVELRLKESEQVLNHREADLARREKALSDQTRVSADDDVKSVQ